MPSDTTRNTLIRQWELLKLLPKRGTGKTAKDLTEALNDAGFKVSKRQIERDLSTLSGPFPLDCKDMSIPYGWKWMDGRSADLPGLTVAEALSMKLVEDTLQNMLPKSVLNAMEGTFRQAHEKLAALDGKNPNVRWANKIANVQPTLPMLTPKVDREVLENVQEALLHDRQLEIEYQSVSAETSSPLILHPLGLVNSGPVSYLVATAFEYKDIRLYALHRMNKAVKRDEPSARPKDFKLDDYINSGALQFGNNKTIHLKAHVAEWLAQYLAETPLSTDQKLTADEGKVRLTATLRDSWQLMWWILSHGPDIEVLAPVALRSTIADRLKQAADHYGI